MKLLIKIGVGLMLSYVLFWSAIAAYFTYADRYKSTLESHLTQLFDRAVTIDNIETVWRGLSPRLKIDGFKVAGDSFDEPALAFKSLSAVVSPGSVLSLWPSFTEFSVDQPLVEIVSLDNNRLQIAGLDLVTKRRSSRINQRLVSWLLDQKEGTWLNGEILWRQEEGLIHRYQNINIEFGRLNQNRMLKASVNTSKGALAFTARTNGDLLSRSHWNATLKVEGGEGESLLSPEDFSINVEDGQGRLALKTLDIGRIRDFIKLTGLAGEAGWLLDAKLNGRLHDVHLDFSGPLLDIEAWSLEAAASDIAFKSVGSAPAMNNLSGKLTASTEGGTFLFNTRRSEFSWPRWFDKKFPISHAMGEFKWELNPSGDLIISVVNGEFKDQNARIGNVQAQVFVDARSNKVSNFGQLFKVNSVANLSYSDDGELIERDNNAPTARLTIDASAEFDVFEISKLSGYLPSAPKLEKFKTWADDAFLSGQVTNGVVTYNGEISSSAFKQGRAVLDASANFSDVTVDYAPVQNWPAATKAHGSATIKNELLTISPSDIWLNGDQLHEAELQITSLFQRDRALMVRAKTTTSLIKGMDFLFKGPLIKPQDRAIELPIIPVDGAVDITVKVDMELNDIINTRVIGTAEVRDGSGLLPEGVPINDVNASVDFTERKIQSNNVRATFLGGETRGKVVTVKEAQPPVVKLLASGVAHTEALKPWVGEHLLTWFNGQAPWTGNILFDRNRVEIDGKSSLEGVDVIAPTPLKKTAEQEAALNLSMAFGGNENEQSLWVSYKGLMSAQFRSNKHSEISDIKPSLFDNSLISIGHQNEFSLKPGVNFSIQSDDINLDDWLSAIIDLASFEPDVASDNTDFLDAMRSINIAANNPSFLGREFGLLDISMVSVDGQQWIGTLKGDNVDGTLQMRPREDIGNYGVTLSRLILGVESNPNAPLERIDYSLQPSRFPTLSIEIDDLKLSGKSLGAMSFSARPEGEQWRVDNIELIQNGIITKAHGSWINNSEFGSISKFTFDTIIDEAEGAFNELDFDGVIKKGEGAINGELRWIGAPHEFDYGRLNGEFDAFIKDGELVKIEPGGVNLLGLLNFNAIARRLVFDFRDVFASGLKFDRMRYTGAFADGEAILSEASVLAPSVFIRMEGKIDLDKELVDLEVHVSPELGGNLALLSALANPAAGAFVFVTQRIFKDEMRNSSFKSYRALGTWKDFEMVELSSVAVQRTNEASGFNKEPMSNAQTPEKLEATPLIDEPVD